MFWLVVAWYERVCWCLLYCCNVFLCWLLCFDFGLVWSGVCLLLIRVWVVSWCFLGVFRCAWFGLLICSFVLLCLILFALVCFGFSVLWWLFGRLRLLWTGCDAVRRLCFLSCGLFGLTLGLLLVWLGLHVCGLVLIICDVCLFICLFCIVGCFYLLLFWF